MSQEAADKVAARVKGTLDYSGFGDVDMVRCVQPLASLHSRITCRAEHNSRAAIPDTGCQ